MTTGQKDQTAQNVQFTDQNPAYDYTVDSEYDPTRSSTDTGDTTLENFFSRPLKIEQFEWSTSEANFGELFNPWTLYWQNPRVINRITNFALLRAKLHVKIIINGNGFHYGRLIASYQPLHQEDDFTVQRSLITQDNIQASQRPHVYLDPTNSQGGSMVLPFFWYRNALSIPKQAWQEMGTIKISTLVPLKHANGAVDRVTISVFAWAEDVVMSVPTSFSPGSLVPQCADEPLDCQASDEYGKDGPISAPAGTVARIAGMLSSAPVIGPFAKATELAASAVSGMARIFGYSRPVVLADIQPYKPTLMGNLANTNVADTAMKLSLDGKQELTIDPRVTGLSHTDEMTIKSVACRESYLTQFDWLVDTSPETALFSTEVNPVVWDTYGPEDEELHFPACCFATLPFAHWRGSMRYRFQIVASNFHKGRLKVVWDPYAFESNEYNTNYVHIVDIAESKDFTVEIGWGADRSYLSHKEPGLDAKIFRNGSPTQIPLNLANGVLAVYVVNELTVPNSTVNNDIKINVFVSAGEDFEVNNPDSDYISNLSWFRPPAEGLRTLAAGGASSVHPALFDADSRHADADPNSKDNLLDAQSAEEAIPQTDKEDTGEPSAPMQLQIAGDMGPSQDVSDQMLLVHYGDPVVSFRQCLKRYNLHAFTLIDRIGSTWYSRTQNNVPFYKGNAPNPVHGTYNYCKMTLLNYLLPAYTGYRGGLRWKYQLCGGSGNKNDYMAVTRLPVRDTGSAFEETVSAEGVATSVAASNREAMLALPDSWPGSAATATIANPVLEVELPYMNSLRFGFAKEADLTQSGFNDYYHRLDALVAPTSDGSGVAGRTHLACFNSVGEDFNLFFFTGCPIAYRETIGPVPT
jgi:hypothetical protein